MTDPDYLAHFGVKGMKWGQHKAKLKGLASKAAASGTPKDPPSADAVRAKTLKSTARKSSTDALSNKELQDLVTRMNLEQQYVRLGGGPQKSVMAKGLSFVSSQLSDDNVNRQLKSLAGESSKADTLNAALETAVAGAKIVDQILNKKR
jgi:hypothetical protein